jgi:hypothetical protein
MARRNAQAALEFLTTYAWAFILILIMIGALGYFGVLDPSNLLPDKCTVSSEFECMDWFISSANNEITIKLRNNVGEPIFANLSVTSDSAIPLACSYYNKTMGTGQQLDFNISTCNLAAAGFLKGERGKVEFTIRYHTIASGARYLHESKGELFSSVG